MQLVVRSHLIPKLALSCFRTLPLILPRQVPGCCSRVRDRRCLLTDAQLRRLVGLLLAAVVAVTVRLPLLNWPLPLARPVRLSGGVPTARRRLAVSMLLALLSRLSVQAQPVGALRLICRVLLSLCSRARLLLPRLTMQSVAFDYRLGDESVDVVVRVRVRRSARLPEWRWRNLSSTL